MHTWSFCCMKSAEAEASLKIAEAKIIILNLPEYK